MHIDNITQYVSEKGLMKSLQKVRKKQIPFQYVDTDDTNSLPPKSYTNAKTNGEVVTIFDGDKETDNVVGLNDIIISGIEGEKYNIGNINKLVNHQTDQFVKKYQGTFGKTITPADEQRMAIQYTEPEEITFTAPWGSKMLLKQGDWLIQDGDSFYRIASRAFDLTYDVESKSRPDILRKRTARNRRRSDRAVGEGKTYKNFKHFLENVDK